MKKGKYLILGGMLGIMLAAASCTGRTADNMVPAGETVRVVIPEQDVAEDSIVANGGELKATPDLK